MKNYWKTADSNALFKAVLKLRSVPESEKFFRDLLTMKELQEMVSRFKVARELDESNPRSYIEIARDVGTSTATVTRVAHWLRAGMGGYRLILDRMRK